MLPTLCSLSQAARCRFTDSTTLAYSSMSSSCARLEAISQQVRVLWQVQRVCSIMTTITGKHDCGHEGPVKVERQVSALPPPELQDGRRLSSRHVPSGSFPQENSMYVASPSRKMGAISELARSTRLRRLCPKVTHTSAVQCTSVSKVPCSGSTCTYPATGDASPSCRSQSSFRASFTYDCCLRRWSQPRAARSTLRRSRPSKCHQDRRDRPCHLPLAQVAEAQVRWRNTAGSPIPELWRNPRLERAPLE